MRRALIVTAVLAATALPVAAASPAAAHTDGPPDPTRIQRAAVDSPLQNDKIAHLRNQPGQAGISGCFMQTRPLLVTSGTNSVEVYDVSDPAQPALVGSLPNVVFENEAMNCGERQTATGVRRFALIGVDLVQAAPGDYEHVNVGGGELIVVDVTNPAAPTIRSRTPGSTSTHTVACVDPVNCRYAYSAGDDSSDRFSIFDLRSLGKPQEVDSDPATAGVQAFFSPTAAHKWNFDAAGVGTHTGFDGASMWDVSDPVRPRLLATTGKAGRGEDPDYPGWNDFVLHNSFRPNATAFKPGVAPSFAHGNVLLVTEEDYEQPDCARAGSFQTWWVKRLDGRAGGIVPLDKVELADLGSFPSPVGAFCSAHWFDFRPGGLVAAGFYGGGTQILDVRDPSDIKPYAHSVWGASEVWDAMWVPVYRDGKQTSRRTNVVYAIDLVRGLDVYAVDVPGDGVGAVPQPRAAAESRTAGPLASPLLPGGVVAGGVVLSGLVSRLRRRHGAV